MHEEVTSMKASHSILVLYHIETLSFVLTYPQPCWHTYMMLFFKSNHSQIWLHILHYRLTFIYSQIPSIHLRPYNTYNVNDIILIAFSTSKITDIIM